MIWMALWGCGMGLQPLEKIVADTAVDDIIPSEPTDEPSEQPSNEPSSVDPMQIDNDGDGVSEFEGDCDDANPAISPNAAEIPYDGINNDCNPNTPDDDIDGDGYPRISDCDDLDPTVHPNALDNSCDGIDDNCDGETDEDTPQPDNAEPFDTLSPIHIGSLNNKNDTVFAESFLFPLHDEDGFQFWFDDDTDCIIFITDDPDHFICTVSAPEEVSILVDLLWQQQGTSSFTMYDSQTIPAGQIASFEGGTLECGYQDGGTFQFEVSSLGESSCMDSYTISCVKDDD